jgi:hypothetical protein
MGLGSELKRLREEAGLKRPAFTEMLGISNSRYTKTEQTGYDPKMDRERIEDFFGMSLEELVRLPSIREIIKRKKESMIAQSAQIAGPDNAILAIQKSQPTSQVNSPGSSENTLGAEVQGFGKEGNITEWEEKYKLEIIYRDKYIEALQENVDNLKSQVLFLQRIAETNLSELVKSQSVILSQMQINLDLIKDIRDNKK